MESIATAYNTEETFKMLIAIEGFKNYLVVNQFLEVYHWYL